LVEEKQAEKRAEENEMVTHFWTKIFIASRKYQERNEFLKAK